MSHVFRGTSLRVAARIALALLGSVLRPAFCCGELWLHASDPAISGIWSLYHTSNNERPVYRRVSLATAGASVMHLFHSSDGGSTSSKGWWNIGPHVSQDGSSAVVFAESWALTPLEVAEHDANFSWVYSDRPYPSITAHSAAPSRAPLSMYITCYSRPLTLHMSSSRYHAIGGFYLPTGARQDGAQVYRRPGYATGEWGVAGRAMLLTFQASSAALDSGGRWVVKAEGDPASGGFAFLDIPANLKPPVSSAEIEETTLAKQMRDDAVDLTSHLNAQSAPGVDHGADHDRPPLAKWNRGPLDMDRDGMNSLVWMIPSEGWQEDNTLAVRLLHEGADVVGLPHHENAALRLRKSRRDHDNSDSNRTDSRYQLAHRVRSQNVDSIASRARGESPAHISWRHSIAGGSYSSSCANIVLNNGLAMPRLGLGAGNYPTPSAAAAAVRTGLALKLPSNGKKNAMEFVFSLVDAQILSAESEAVVGSALLESERGQSVWLTLRVAAVRFDASFDEAFRATYNEALASLSRLRRSHAELFLLPAPTHTEDWRGWQESWLGQWRALERLHAEGRALTLGVADFHLRPVSLGLTDNHYEWLKVLLATSKVQASVIQAHFDPMTLVELSDPDSVSSAAATGRLFSVLRSLEESGLVLQARSLLRQVAKEVEGAADRLEDTTDVTNEDSVVAELFKTLTVRRELRSAAKASGKDFLQIVVQWWFEVAGPALLPVRRPHECSISNQPQGRIALVVRSSLTSHLLSLGLATQNISSRLSTVALGALLRLPTDLASRDLVRLRSVSATNNFALASSRNGESSSDGIAALAMGPRPSPARDNIPAFTPESRRSISDSESSGAMSSRRSDLNALRAALLAPPAESVAAAPAAQEAVSRVSLKLLTQAAITTDAPEIAPGVNFDGHLMKAMQLWPVSWWWVNISAVAVLVLVTMVGLLSLARAEVAPVVRGPRHSGAGLTARRASFQASEPDSPVPPGAIPPGSGPGTVSRPKRVLLEPSPSQVTDEEVKVRLLSSEGSFDESQWEVGAHSHSLQSARGLVEQGARAKSRISPTLHYSGVPLSGKYKAFINGAQSNRQVDSRVGALPARGPPSNWKED